MKWLIGACVVCLVGAWLFLGGTILERQKLEAEIVELQTQIKTMKAEPEIVWDRLAPETLDVKKINDVIVRFPGIKNAVVTYEVGRGASVAGGPAYHAWEVYVEQGRSGVHELTFSGSGESLEEAVEDLLSDVKSLKERLCETEVKVAVPGGAAPYTDY
ncbi:MAG: hypothetical protein ABIJ26_05465 [Candidatus Margulisiibacteriota bacterium]